jgi:hypothetical protein
MSADTEGFKNGRYRRLQKWPIPKASKMADAEISADTDTKISAETDTETDNF